MENKSTSPNHGKRIKYGFLGDTAFLKGSENTNFAPILKALKTAKIVLNLEAIFEKKGQNFTNIKDKISLKQPEVNISLLHDLDPYLVNTGNNHSNDCGNLGVDFTKKILTANKFSHLGSGAKNKEHNIYIDTKNQHVFLSFTTRETDLTGSILWEDDKIKGPKDISLSQIEQVRRKYPQYKIIILMHWGYEHQNYPHPSIRNLAKEIIKSGGDLIIGNHSHVIQGYEEYKGKKIFYCLGNFLFTDISYIIQDKKYKFFQYPRSKKGIIPILSISKTKVSIDKIYQITRIKKSYKIQTVSLKKYNLPFKLGDYGYQIFFICYSKINLIRMIWELKIYQLIKRYSEK